MLGNAHQIQDIITTDVLSEFYPLKALSPYELDLLAENTTVVPAKKGKIIIELGESDHQTLYLLRGKLLLTPADDHAYVIEAGTEAALKPISHLNPHQYTVQSLSYVEFFRVDNHVIDNIVKNQSSSGTEVRDMNFSEQALNSTLFRKIYEDLQRGSLEIPTLPKIALEIQKSIEQGANVRELELMIQSDAVLAAALVRTANCPLYLVREHARTVEQAILRLGMGMVKNIVINYAMRNYYNSQLPRVKQLMKYAWTHSAEVAALSYVLSKQLNLFDPEQALLMGLMHDIGMFPILVYVDRFPDLVEDVEHIDMVLQSLHGDVGAAVLAQWEFPEEFVTVARESDDWFRDTAPEADYCDLVLMAQLHSFIGQKPDKIKALVGESSVCVERVPAFRKLGLTAFSPEHGIALLADANHYLAPIKRLLSIGHTH